jgi:hypothetical protein
MKKGRPGYRFGSSSARPKRGGERLRAQKKGGSTKGETAGEQVSDASAPNYTSETEPASDEKILQLV